MPDKVCCILFCVFLNTFTQIPFTFPTKPPLIFPFKKEKNCFVLAFSTASQGNWNLEYDTMYIEETVEVSCKQEWGGCASAHAPKARQITADQTVTCDPIKRNHNYQQQEVEKGATTLSCECAKQRLSLVSHCADYPTFLFFSNSLSPSPLPSLLLSCYYKHSQLEILWLEDFRWCESQAGTAWNAAP